MCVVTDLGFQFASVALEKMKSKQNVHLRGSTSLLLSFSWNILTQQSCFVRSKPLFALLLTVMIKFPQQVPVLSVHLYADWQSRFNQCSIHDISWKDKLPNFQRAFWKELLTCNALLVFTPSSSSSPFLSKTPLFSLPLPRPPPVCVVSPPHICFR